jgi:hypothetical protein
MSLWTPSGEHPVGDERGTQPRGAALGSPGAGSSGPDGSGPGAGSSGPDGSGPGAGQEDLEALRRQLADTPVDVIVANHCYGLFELAAVYLSESPPRLEQARTAIDALGFLVDGLGERLGDAHPALRDALAQIRLAFVQISAAPTGGTTADGA